MMFGPDLYLDKDAFQKACTELNAKCGELDKLRADIQTSFEQLQKDWDSDAGKKFFNQFDELMEYLKKYSTVFEYMSNNLSTAAQKYDEVFRDADAVASVQYQRDK